MTTGVTPPVCDHHAACRQGDWRQHLADAADAAAGPDDDIADCYAFLGDDSFSPLARMYRVTDPISLPPNAPKGRYGPIGFGGAAIIDYTNSCSGSGDVRCSSKWPTTAPTRSP